jgi:NADPH:quinone reductase-like Zn-dependent oxidoreductase
MRAWKFSRRGSPRDVLELDPEFLTPSLDPTSSSLLIRISHAALNPAGPVLMSLIPTFLLHKPSIPELDFSGTIFAVGSHASSRFAPGTKVFGCLLPAKMIRSGKGVLGEYIVVSEDEGSLSIVPDGVGMDEAAGLGSTGQTAVKMCLKAGMSDGKRVLVNGASGGVGTTVCQVARAMGASFVVGICSGRNAEFVNGIGVDEV